MGLGATKLGSQIWLEPDDSRDRVRALCRGAQEAGLGRLRVFLMWPWIEPRPGQWEWRVFDEVFDAAADLGLGIKATLTANSGPWHVGTPSLLHSHTVFLSEKARDASRLYVEQCVSRYRGHPALAQWILWNEPDGNRIGAYKTPQALAFWRDMLRAEFAGDLSALNRRWRTGYAEFAEIPFAEHILHEAHEPWHNWASYGPRLMEWRFKSAWLNHELTWVADQVRALDLDHETCVNPTAIHANGAEGASDFGAIGRIVDVVGASYHPAWMFGFADRRDFPALMNAGVRLEFARPGVARVEVTEVQTGNTLKSSNRPSDASADEVARFHLASLAAGAESVTGWCLNARSQDFEAGDWALLDDADGPSARSATMRRLSGALDTILAAHGAWRRAAAAAFVVSDPQSHALEWIEANVARTPVPGRLADDGAHGAALIAAEAMGHGLPVDIVPWSGLPDDGAGKVAIASHAVGIDADGADRAERFAASGGHLLLDATTAHKTFDAELWRPWPGGLADRLGLRVAGLESDPGGWPVAFGSFAPVTLLAVRSRLVVAGGDWTAVPGFRFARDHEPLALTRRHGAGRVTVCRGLIGPSLVHQPEARALLSELLRTCFAQIMPELRPAVAGAGIWSTPVETDDGPLTLVMAPSATDRGGRPVVVQAPAGAYACLWSGAEHGVDAVGEMSLAMPEGIALLRSIPGG